MSKQCRDPLLSKMVSKQNLKPKGLFLFLLLFDILRVINSLNCYECFWDDSPESTTKESLEELVLLKDRKFPVSKHYVGLPDRPRPLTGEEVRKECMRVTCQSRDHSCLKWSYITNSPKNITYMCVGNPQKRSGCFTQEIKSKDIKQFLKLEACLCDEDYCNTASSRNLFSIFYLCIVLASVLISTYFLS